jgi:hypothetical protein
MAPSPVICRQLLLLSLLWPRLASGQIDTTHGITVPWPTVNLAVVGNAFGASFMVAPLLDDRPGPVDDSLVEVHIGADSLQHWLGRAHRLLAIGESLQAVKSVRLLTASVGGTLGDHLALTLDGARPPGPRLLLQIRTWNRSADWAIGAPVEAGPPLLAAVTRALTIPPETATADWPTSCKDIRLPRLTSQPKVFGPVAAGRAWLSYRVDATGHVQADQIWLLLAETPEAAERAFLTIRQTRYEPGTCDGRPVSYRLSRRFAFRSPQ